MQLLNSKKLWQKAKKIIPAGTQTLSKGPDQFVQGVSPIFLQKGKGCFVWDVDGNKYIDYPLALGPIILGYDYPAVNKAVIKQLHQGTTFTLPHPIETELAEILIDLIPCAEMVRFGKNGVDATSAAVRVARSYTGREKIAYYGYHGWQDWFAITTSRNKGIPKVLKNYIFEFKFNDLNSLKRIFIEYPKEIAAVIMEVPDEEQKNNFYKNVIKLAHKNGALFILDEIVTGFRYALAGAQEYYHLKPDLACFGKGMANGFPISALVGKKEFMKELEKNVFFSTTFGGETLSIAASIATIEEIKVNNVITHLWKLGQYFKQNFNKLSNNHRIPLSVVGLGPRTHFKTNEQKIIDPILLKSLFLQETIRQGVLFGGPIFMSYSHNKKIIDDTLESCEKALRYIKKAVEGDRPEKYLKGKKIATVFRQRD